MLRNLLYSLVPYLSRLRLVVLCSRLVVQFLNTVTEVHDDRVLVGYQKELNEVMAGPFKGIRYSKRAGSVSTYPSCSELTSMNLMGLGILSGRFHDFGHWLPSVYSPVSSLCIRYQIMFGK